MINQLLLKVFTYILVFCGVVCNAEKSSHSDVVIQSWGRKIALGGVLVKDLSALTYINNGSKEVKGITVCHAGPHKHSLSSSRAILSQINSSESQDVTIIPANSPSTHPDLVCHTASFPIPPGSQGTLELHFIFTHGVEVFPQTRTQTTPQRVMYRDNLWGLSPHSVESQELTIDLAGDMKMISHTKGEGWRKDNSSSSKLKYGPDTSGDGLKMRSVEVHMQTNTTLLEVLTYNKTVWVSHWGLLTYRENFHLHNWGSSIVGDWARDTMESMPEAPVLSTLKMVLPKGASNIKFWDQVGNVSATHVMRTADGDVGLAASPRVPLHGAWNATCSLGYTEPLRYAGKIDSQGRRHVKFNFQTPIIYPEYHVGDHNVQVVLPEGSSNISLSIPFQVDHEVSKVSWYLDTVGRPMVTMQLSNTHQAHDAQVVVSYDFNPVWFLHEPLLLSFGVFVIFVVLIIMERVEVSQTYTASGKAREKSQKIKYHLSVLNYHIQDFLKALSQVGSSQKGRKGASSEVEQMQSSKSKISSIIQQDILPGHQDSARLKQLTEALLLLLDQGIQSAKSSSDEKQDKDSQVDLKGRIQTLSKQILYDY